MSENYYFIVNSKARSGKSMELWAELEDILKEKEISYKAYRTARAGHAKELASKITSVHPDCNLVIVGGDGTVNEVINGVNDIARVHFGYIPIGSANDLARGLGIWEQTPKDLLLKMLDGQSSFDMDLGKVTLSDGSSSYFAISSGIGIDAEVSKAALTSNWKKVLNRIGLGKLTYKLLTVGKLFSMPHVEATVQLDDKEPMAVHKAIFIAAMNQPVEGGNVPMAPNATSSDGKLTLCCVNGYSRPGAFLALPSLLAAKHEGKKGFWLEDFNRAVVTLENDQVLHGDGEYLGDEMKVVFECIPGGMHLI